MQRFSGHLQKMPVSLVDSKVEYHLPLDEQRVPLNPLIGQKVSLQFEGAIHCENCGRKTKKSFNQGYCYPCFTKLARCDSCIVSPEKCHFHMGTCREPEWAEKFCMTDHFVYLANSSGVKVGITRGNQLPTRWIDQGATQALPVLRVATRQQSGLVEDAIRKHVADKTNWRTMLKGDAEVVDLFSLRDQLLEICDSEIQALQQQFGLQAIQLLDDHDETRISYPVDQYPSKISSFNLDKDPLAEGTLLGIKGQYLILDTGVINIRKYTSYQVSFTY